MIGKEDLRRMRKLLETNPCNRCFIKEGCPLCKIFWIILEIDEGRIQTNVPDDKKTIDVA